MKVLAESTAMEGKRYSLRSEGGGGQQQTKLEFPCRRSGSRAAGKKRQQQLRAAEREADENSGSPPKRSRVAGKMRGAPSTGGRLSATDAAIRYESAKAKQCA